MTRVLDNAKDTRNNVNFVKYLLSFFFFLLIHFGIVVADLYRVLTRNYFPKFECAKPKLCFKKLVFIRLLARCRDEISERIRLNFAAWPYKIITCKYRLILVYIRCLLLRKGSMENDSFARTKEPTRQAFGKLHYFGSSFSQTPPSMHTKITLVLC